MQTDPSNVIQRQVFSLSEITESIDQQPIGDFNPPLEGLGEVWMQNESPEVVEKRDIGFGIISGAQTSPTPPEEGLSRTGLINITKEGSGQALEPSF
jgi:hypothetical protein